MKTSVPQTHRPHGDGWKLWYEGALQPGLAPYRYVEVEIWRRGYMKSELVDPQSLSPYFNVAGLWWRPAGPIRNLQYDLRTFRSRQR